MYRCTWQKGKGKGKGERGVASFLPALLSFLSSECLYRLEVKIVVQVKIIQVLAMN